MYLLSMYSQDQLNCDWAVFAQRGTLNAISRENCLNLSVNRGNTAFSSSFSWLP